jgi:hypothetical protein
MRICFIGRLTPRRPSPHRRKVLPERVKPRSVRPRSCDHQHLTLQRKLRVRRAHQFAKPPLHQVSLDDDLFVLGHNHADAGAWVARSNEPQFDEVTANPDTASSNAGDFWRASQTLCARNPWRAMRRRTSTEASLSAGDAPSCADGSTLPVPTLLTCACETRAFEYASCFAGGKSAFPSPLLKVQKSVR